MVAKKGGRAARNARLSAEEEMGKSIISDKNYLTLSGKNKKIREQKTKTSKPKKTEY